jgi:hypothetical protein
MKHKYKSIKYTSIRPTGIAIAPLYGKYAGIHPTPITKLIPLIKLRAGRSLEFAKVVNA